MPRLAHPAGVSPRSHPMAQLSSARPPRAPGLLSWAFPAWAWALGGKPQGREEALKPGWSEAVAASHGWPVPDPPCRILGCAESSRCPWIRIYLQEHPALPPASSECGCHLPVPLSTSLACAFPSALSHFKAFLRAARNSEPGASGWRACATGQGQTGEKEVTRGVNPILGAVLDPLPPHRGAGEKGDSLVL